MTQTRERTVRAEMDRLKVLAIDLIRLADVVVEAYEELYDAGLTPSREGEPVPMGKHGFRVTDPTGAVVVNGQKAGLRRKARKVASRLREIEPILEEASDEIAEAFAWTDPEMREKLERLRELEALEARG